MAELKEVAWRVGVALVFFAIVSPIALLVRLFHDPVAMKWDRKASTYRVQAKKNYRPNFSRAS
ncbi:hypothetical protein [Burkholderia ubonensis]|uniref:hypothetical protein n=1 Tax=Burkholderia ubonensis TaxID=101571 RepID=UPI00145335C4|nr:hypothetical protein [Burkholderia ubonensis]VWB42482.1 hypothetical protein BUB20358_01883 [Burkholderia ubonensis]